MSGGRRETPRAKEGVEASRRQNIEQGRVMCALPTIKTQQRRQRRASKLHDHLPRRLLGRRLLRRLFGRGPGGFLLRAVRQRGRRRGGGQRCKGPRSASEGLISIRCVLRPPSCVARCRGPSLPLAPGTRPRPSCCIFEAASIFLNILYHPSELNYNPTPPQGRTGLGRAIGVGERRGGS